MGVHLKFSASSIPEFLIVNNLTFITLLCKQVVIFYRQATKIHKKLLLKMSGVLN